VFTNAGSISINASMSGPGACPNAMLLCAQPLTFFLKSPKAQTITLHLYLDNAGAVYVDGMPFATGVTSIKAVDVNVPQGPFALSLLSCSTDGPSNGFTSYDQFLTNATYGLTVDYDRTFHRNGN
jgi:hypothetical protein